MSKLTIKQKNLFDALHESRSEDFKTFNKRSFRGVWSSIIDKYPESAHFVYELLQNADDAEATEVYITVKPDSILFKHNGTKHFDVTPEDAEQVGDINSITGIGYSSKIDTQNKIGKFGVGFKAVFQYTDTPEIYDDTFKFKIENYIVPTLLTNDHPERKEGETLFVFPFRDKESSYQEIVSRLENLQNPILFLRHLQRIIWRIDKGKNKKGDETVYSKEILDKKEYEDEGITLEHYNLHEATKEREIFLFSKYVIITDKNQVESTHVINVGFYYDPINKKLITDTIQNIFCFFPTKETFKTCFVSHAPFLLTDNRQNLKPNENLNKDLITLIAELAAQAVIILRDYEIDKKTHLINENLTEIIPKYRYGSYWGNLDQLFEKPIRASFKELIDNERIFISRNGKYLSLYEAYIGTPKELVDLISQEQLVMLKKGDPKGDDNEEDDNYYEDDDYYEDDEELLDIENVDFLKWELAQNITKQENELYGEINEYSSENFAKDINPSFMDKQEIRWVTKMYTFLRSAAPKLWKITDKDKSKIKGKLPFRNAPIIKTQKGEWVPPFINDITPNVFLPLKKDNQSSYNFIDNEYLNNEMAKKFFYELDIKEPEEYDYIIQVILKKFEGEEFSVDNEDLKTDFNVLLAYYQKVKDKSPQESKYLSVLKEKFYLCGTNNRLNRPSQLYFFNENLEYYFNGKKDLVFLDIDFYSSSIEKFGNNLVLEFLSKLGVKKYPSIIKTTPWSIYSLSKRLQKQISTSGISEYNIYDFELEYFNDFCGNDTIYHEASLYLWNTVLPSIGFSNFENLTLSFRRKYARSYEQAKYNSTFKDALQHNKWLVDKDGYLVSADKVALEDLDPDYDRNNGLVQFLNIEKREKSIIELGGTKEQQDQMDFGKMAKEAAGDLTEEEILQALAKANAEKKGKKDKQKEIDNSSQTLKNNIIDNDVEETYDEEPYSENDNTFSREELRKTDLSEMFVDNHHKQEQRNPSSEDEQEEVDNVMQKLIDQEEKHNKIKELRNTASSAEKYSKEWFDALIELEYRGGTEPSNVGNTSKSISISFSSVDKERGSERIYVFNNPSRSIPMWMEEIGDIEVKCYFLNREDLTLKFEVANVRDNSLRLKASKAYESVLSKIEWNKCTKATIVLKNQIDLMGKLRTAFNELDLDEGFNLKDNLEDNIKFIFGPPGTGKTTNLANKIISQMKSVDVCKILVLAPTNTACDELARKIKEQSGDDCNWLYRFITSADEDLDSIVIDRESSAYDEDKCCIISTIARLSFDGFSGISGFSRLTDLVWDMVICDEASMIPLAEITLAIYTFVNTPFLIAGDPMQIKPILFEEEWKDENIYTMVNLDRFDKPKTEPIQFEIENLGTQYRSVPAIGELFSRYAYDGKLRHHRSKLQNEHSFGQLELKPINFITFKVERYDSIFGIKKLDGSNVHIYSALFAVELFKYIAKKYAEETDSEISIGIVSPYSPQAQLIESLIAQVPNIPSNIKVIIGTVHRFQGGQCNFMIVVLNPPLGIKTASDRIFLNNRNILNVAMSRAQDYLCFLLPHRDTDGYENLYEINNIGRIAGLSPDLVGSYTCDEVEQIIFGHKFYLENNTFVTSHQLTNVYTKASKKYEVRIDEKSVDIQLGTNTYDATQHSTNNVKGPESENDINESPNISEGTLNEQNDDKSTATFEDANQYYEMFKEKHFDLRQAIERLIADNTMVSIYVLVQIFGNKEICSRFNWDYPDEDIIKSHRSECKAYNLFNEIYPLLFNALRQHKLPIKNIGDTFIKDLSFEKFKGMFLVRIQTKKLKKIKPKQKHTPKIKTKDKEAPEYKYSSNRPTVNKTGKLYSDYEYGLSDW